MANAKQAGSKATPKAKALEQAAQTATAKSTANTNPAEPKKTEEKPLAGNISPQTRIKVLKQSNPFREGSKRHQVLAVVLGSSTVGEAREKCAGKGLKRQPNSRSLGRAVEKGIIELDVTSGS